MVLQKIGTGATLFAAGLALQGCGDSSSPAPAPHPMPSPSPSVDPSSSPPTTTLPASSPASLPPAPSPAPSNSTTASPAPSPPPPSPCVAFPEKPPVPDSALDLNGHEYPHACYNLNADGNHFFVIGDWGGQCGWGVENECGVPGHTYSDRTGQHDAMSPRPMWNRHHPPVFVQGIDDNAQQRVAAAMDAIAAQSPPEFVVSVGDHFYPGGIAEHCNGVGSTYEFTTIPHQFNSTFEMIYNSTHFKNKEWMGVFGNHDYGGVCVNGGWPQQIYYTWNQVSKRWVLPSQYYYRNLRFSKGGSDDWDAEDFSIDMFFLESNHADAGTGDENHDICGEKGNTDNSFYCEGFLGEDNSGNCQGTPLWDSVNTCADYFQQLWRDQMVWLEDLLDKSTADWQMIVTHFPPNYRSLQELKPLVERYGVDLIMTGHTHSQHVYYQQAYNGSDGGNGGDYPYDLGDTAWVISGGGGGVSSEHLPDTDDSKPCRGEGESRVCDQATGNDDQYGFMDMVVTKQHLSIRPYSWGKTVDGSQIMRHGAEVSPRPRADLRDARPLKPKTEVYI